MSIHQVTYNVDINLWEIDNDEEDVDDDLLVELGKPVWAKDKKDIRVAVDKIYTPDAFHAGYEIIMKEIIKVTSEVENGIR
jgi:hypothetical protein